MHRRHFLQTAAAAASTSFLRAQDAGGDDGISIAVFSKPFRELGPAESAKLVEQVGWDSIEIPVRSGWATHIEPDKAADELPKMIGALAKLGKKVDILTTSISKVDKDAESLLRLAVDNGIRHYRLASGYYDFSKPIAPQVADARAVALDIAAMNRDIGITGGLQNHSGPKFIGAPVWDIAQILEGVDPSELGIHFDIGHATIEGGYAWRTHWRRLRPHFAAVYVKDFSWQKTKDGWKARWCPLGDGMVDPTFFQDLLESGYRGTISMHQEYKVGKGEEYIAHSRRDLDTLKSWLKG